MERTDVPKPNFPPKSDSLISILAMGSLHPYLVPPYPLSFPIIFPPYLPILLLSPSYPYLIPILSSPIPILSPSYPLLSIEDREKEEKED